MISKFLLLAVLMTPDTGRYQEFVGAFDTREECEKVRTALKGQALKSYSPDHIFHSVCVPARTLTSVEA